MKKALPVIVALLLAAFAAVGIVNWARKVSDQGQMISCVVAKRDIRAGWKLTQAELAVSTARVPTKLGAGGRNLWQFVFDELTPADKMGTLEGRTLLRDLRAGDPILETMLRPIAEETPRIDWKTNIPEGKRAIAIPVNEIQSVAGLVSVGDHVDVLVTLSVPADEGEEPQTRVIPIPMGQEIHNVEVPVSGSRGGAPITVYLIQDIEVLAVGDQPYDLANLYGGDVFKDLGLMAKGSGGSITVALTPEQIQRVCFAINYGASSFTLSLRPAGDATRIDSEELEPVTFDDLMKALKAEP